MTKVIEKTKVDELEKVVFNGETSNKWTPGSIENSEGS